MRLAVCLALLGWMLPAGCQRSGEEGEHVAARGQVGHEHTQGSAPPQTGRLAAEEWCFEHGVPEAVCTRCRPALIEQFKAKGDWCAGHGLPESQCLLCNPELEAQFAALRPQRPEQPSAELSAGFRVERLSTSLRPENNPLCDVESSLIRFLDPSIAAKAGIGLEPATLRRMSAFIECPAEVRYDETRLARITPRADGVLAEVAVDRGSDVQADAVLAVVDSPTMGEAKAAYIEALQRRRIAQSDLDRHDAIHDGIEGMLRACSEAVSSDQLRVRYAEVRIGEFKGRLLNAHSQLELARQRFGREQSLMERSVTSESALETAKRDLEQAEADFAAIHEAIDIEMETEHLALSRALTVADVGLNAARNRLQILGIGDDEISRLDAGAVEALARYTVRSPMAGRIVQRQAVVGETITREDELFAVADTSRMWLLLSLQERDLVTVGLGDRVHFMVDGLPGRSFEGRIDWISSEVEEPTRTIRARVPMNNGDGLLRANMYGQARVVVHDNDEVLTVPEAAVQTDGCCNIVFLKDTETVYRPRKVELGTASRGMVEVLDGLAAGDSVVTTGSFLLKTEILKASIGAGCCEVDPGR